MKRWIAGGLLGVAGLAVASDPVPLSVYPPVPQATLPGTLVPTPTRPVVQAVPATPAPATDVTKPLSSVLDAPAAAPAMPAYPYIGMPTLGTVPAESCAPCDAASGWRIPRLKLGPTPCLDRLCNWFAWQSGPRVMPALTPTPYMPPLRHYFPAGRQPTCGSPVADAGSAPFFGSRLALWSRGCSTGNCGAAGGCKDGRCDGCYESVAEKALGCVTPRQFGRLQPQCWVSPRAPGVSGCAAGDCGGHAGAVGPIAGAPGVVAPAGGVVYPGVGGGYRFASPVYVPPAPPITASVGGVVAAGAVATPGVLMPGSVAGNGPAGGK